MRGLRSFLFVSMLAAACLSASPRASAARLSEPRTNCLSVDLTSREAIPACTAAIKRKPGDGRLFVRRGSAWTAQGDFDFAVGDLSKAISLDRNNATAFLFRGLARERKGQLLESLEDFNRCLELNAFEAEAEAAIQRVSAALAAGRSPRDPPEVEVAVAGASALDEPSPPMEQTIAEQTIAAPPPSPAGGVDDASLVILAVYIGLNIAVILAIAQTHRENGLEAENC